MKNYTERSILLVDDSTIVHQTVENLLREAGCDRITTASTAAETMDLLGRESFHMVLLDYFLPDRDGEYVLDYIRESHPETIVIMLSGQPEKDVVVRLMRKADNYIIKDDPVRVKTELLGAIAAAFAMQELREENARLTNELKEKNRELGETIVNLEHAQTMLVQVEKIGAVGQLAAGIAHEINNPLGFIKSNLRTLETYAEKLVGFIDELSGAGSAAAALRKYGIARIREDLAAVVAESMEGAGRIERITGHIRVFSDIGRDKPEICDVNAILNRVIGTAIERSGESVNIVRCFSDMPTIEFYTFVLDQAFRNVLTNAFEAMGENGTLKVATAVDGKNVVVTIEDDGCGIPAENLAKVFNPFFTTKETGVGLGLSIAYDIIRTHGGTITLESQVGIGTLVTIVLPVKPAG
jgi:two-component system NtrC family sensor kinase